MPSKKRKIESVEAASVTEVYICIIAETFMYYKELNTYERRE